MNRSYCSAAEDPSVLPPSSASDVLQLKPSFNSSSPSSVLCSFDPSSIMKSSATTTILSSSPSMTTTIMPTHVAPHLCLKRNSITAPPHELPPTVIKNRLVHGWIEAMRDLSPPRHILRHPNPRCDRATNSDEDIIDDDDDDDDAANARYMAWIAKHPSAFDKFEEIIEAAVGKCIAVFLDYDGTLSPIVDDPECAFMSEEMRKTVKDLSALFPTAIITGRSREKVYEFVQLPELYYAGSHGMDIVGPTSGFKGHNLRVKNTLDEKGGNQMVLFQPASDLTLVMNEVFELLEDKIKNVRGATIEHNKFCISVHFRNVEEEDWLSLAEQVQHVLGSYPKLRLTQGRKILEIRPSIAWNKGKALNYLLQALGSKNRNDFFPIYIGDDRTDEDAFKVVSRRKVGLSILVSNVAKETIASCSLRDTNEVLEFLQNLVKWRRKRLSRFP